MLCETNAAIFQIVGIVSEFDVLEGLRGHAEALFVTRKPPLRHGVAWGLCWSFRHHRHCLLHYHVSP
jgi:hypothetical protein